MPTCRVVIKDALRALRVIAPGDMPHVDELNDGLSALQNLLLELHDARGPLRDIDITAATWIPGENQRIRVQAGDTPTVTLPNAVPMADGYDAYDYGFNPGYEQWGYASQGTTGAADNVQWRQPTDGARIELVGATQELWFYRADINQWLAVYGMTLDQEIPLNQRHAGDIGARLAERLNQSLSLGEIGPGLAMRITRANQRLVLRTGARRQPVRAEYF